MQIYITYTVVPRVMLLIQLINDEYSIHWLLSARDILYSYLLEQRYPRNSGICKKDGL
jgi:hypothetical protein